MRARNRSLFGHLDGSIPSSGWPCHCFEEGNVLGAVDSMTHFINKCASTT